MDNKKILLENISIEKVIQGYVEIKRKGKDFVCICPFHNDTSPSLSISISKQIFNCFVCNVGGNAITFVSKFKNISYNEAMIEIAKNFSIDIGNVKTFNYQPKFTSEQIKIFEINKIAALHFNNLFNSSIGSEAKKYIIDRGVSKSQVSKFMIGFSPIDSKLRNILISNNFNDKEIISSNLIYRNDLNYKYFFTNRIMFPILDEDSNVVGFSGRTLNDNENPKYKNSSENLVFKKSEVLFNLSHSKNIIRSSNEIIILEGYMDVIGLDAIGIQNTVAIMGTSISKQNIDKIKKITNNVKLFLDGDSAGVNAMLKLSKALIAEKMNVEIVNNTSTQDPDELRKSKSKEEILNMISSSKTPIDYLLNYYNENQLDDTNLLNEFQKEVFSLISLETNFINIDKNLNKLANKLNLNLEIIKKEYSKQVRNIHGEGEKKYNGKIINEVSDKSSSNFAEQQIIFSLIQSRENLEYIKNNRSLFQNINNKNILDYIIQGYEKNIFNPKDVNMIREYVIKENINFTKNIDEILNGKYHLVDQNYSLEEVKKIFLTLEIFDLTQEVEIYKEKIKQSKNEDEKNILLQSSKKIQSNIKKLKIQKKGEN